MITISKKVEYSIVFMSFLSHNSGKNVSLTEASKKLQLPYRFLGQLATNLKAGGIIDSQEGKSGGYQLAEGWRDKNLYDLLEALEENKAMVTCLGDKGCARINSCTLKKVWERMEKSWSLELKKIKLSEI